MWPRGLRGGRSLLIRARPSGRTGLRRRHRRAVWRDRGAQLPQGLPNSTHPNATISELADWNDSRQTVSDFDQACRRPAAGQLRELFEAIESFGSIYFRDSCARLENRDVVIG